MAVTTSAVAVERSALYYPWVHFRDDEWVKKALLVFPGLFRMIADAQVPNDTWLVRDLRAQGLVGHADLATPNSQDAQRELRHLIQDDLDANPKIFLHMFGKAAAKQSGQPSFQMHLGKTSEDLAGFLRLRKLAWTPDNPEQSEYSELHPDLGQAVMGTIAMACAEDAGLHIVGVDTPRGPDMNSRLVARDRAGAYKRFVRREVRPNVVQPNADKLFHVLVHFNCNVTDLDAQSLVKLKAEREPMRALKRQIQQLAAEIPEMKDPKIQKQVFRDRANDIVKTWQRDRANLSSYMREVFALDAFGGGAGKFLNVMQEKLIPAGGTGAVATQVLGATAGLAIGLLTHLGTSYTKIQKAEANSPLRYMTLAAHEGATFSVSHSTSGEDQH